MLHKGCKRILRKNFARQADTSTKIFPILGFAHVIKHNFWEPRPDPHCSNSPIRARGFAWGPHVPETRAPPPQPDHHSAPQLVEK